MSAVLMVNERKNESCYYLEYNNLSSIHLRFLMDGTTLPFHLQNVRYSFSMFFFSLFDFLN